MPSNDQRLHRSSASRVYRSKTPSDAAISPFILDPSSVKLSHRLSNTRYVGVWLRIPVSIRLLTSRKQALDAITHLNRLRHPHLEQLLGAVVDSSSHKFLITEAIPGPSLHELISSRSHNPRLNNRLALRIAVDVARAIVYYHTATGSGLPSLCSHTVAYDTHRSRGIVQLTTTCPHADTLSLPDSGTACHTCLSRSLDRLESSSSSSSFSSSPSSSSSSSSSSSTSGTRRRASKSADVYYLARIVIAMFSPEGEDCLRNEQVAHAHVRFVPPELRSCVGMCLGAEARDRLKMTQFCKVLVEGLDSEL